MTEMHKLMVMPDGRPLADPRDMGVGLWLAGVVFTDFMPDWDARAGRVEGSTWSVAVDAYKAIGWFRPNGVGEPQSWCPVVNPDPFFIVMTRLTHVTRKDADMCAARLMVWVETRTQLLLVSALDQWTYVQPVWAGLGKYGIALPTIVPPSSDYDWEFERTG